jgi:flagellar biosynthesis GTPase FlhF
MEKKKVYQRKWFAVLFLFLCAPVGIFLLYRYGHFSKITKGVLSVVFGLIFLIAVIPSDEEESATDKTNSKEEAVEVAAQEDSKEDVDKKAKDEAAAKAKAEEDAKKKAEEEAAAKKKAEEDAKKKAEEEAAAKKKAEEDAKKKAEEEAKAKEASIPREHKSALKKAESYAENMHMSKAGIYDQLTSEYGENFPPEAAQYAIENIVFDWKENALKKAQSYAENMDMSNSAIYDQLVSEYGEKFTPEEAQYAIDNLE